MAVREFNGTTDFLVTSNGSVANFNGAFTIALLVDPRTVALSDATYMAARATTECVAGVFQSPNTAEDIVLGSDSNGDSGVDFNLASNTWVWLVATKGSGTVAARWHKSTYGSGTWTHTAGSSSFADDASSLTAFTFGAYDTSGTLPKAMRLAVAAVWNRSLSDAQIEEFVDQTSDLYNVTGGAPVALWEFNQASTGTAVTDLTGGGADETALTGTTVVTGSDPSGFTFDGIGGGSQSVDLVPATETDAAVTLTVTQSGQHLAISTDSVDGSWTDQAGGTTLAAAIDETTASDSDYIQSEWAPSSSSCRVKLASGSDPASSTGHTIHWRIGKDRTGSNVATVNMTVKLYQGGGDVAGAGTLIASFTRNDVGAFTTYNETLSGTEADSITDYTDLYLEFSATQA